MKNIVLASLLGFGLISSAWATETVNIHERVNNAQAPVHAGPYRPYEVQSPGSRQEPQQTASGEQVPVHC